MSYIQDSNPKLPANDWFTPGIKKRNAFVAPKSGKASCVSSYWESVATPMVSITGYIYPHQIHSTEVLFADVQFNICPTKILLVLAGSLPQSYPKCPSPSSEVISSTFCCCWISPASSWLISTTRTSSQAVC